LISHENGDKANGAGRTYDNHDGKTASVSDDSVWIVAVTPPRASETFHAQVTIECPNNSTDRLIGEKNLTLTSKSPPTGHVIHCDPNSHFKKLAPSPQGLQLIKSFEGVTKKGQPGFFPVDYLYNDKPNLAKGIVDPKSACTIGWGHKVHDLPCVLDGTNAAEAPFLDGMSDTQADDLFNTDLPTYVHRVNNAGIEVDLNQNEFDALLDLAFNHGSIPRDLVNAINHCHSPAIEESFLRQVYSGGVFDRGLKKRRELEIKLFEAP